MAQFEDYKSGDMHIDRTLPVIHRDGIFPKYYEKDYTRLSQIKNRIDYLKWKKQNKKLKKNDRGNM